MAESLNAKGKIAELERELKWSVGRIAQLEAEYDHAEESHEEALVNIHDFSVDVGREAAREMESLLRTSGPAEALAFAFEVFENLSGVNDPETFNVTSLIPQEMKRREFQRELNVQRRRSA